MDDGPCLMAHAGTTTRRRRLARVAIGVAAAITLGGATYVAVALWTLPRVPLGTVVEGVDIGGALRSEALDDLSLILEDRSRQPLRVMVDEIPVDLAPQDVGLKLDGSATLAQLQPGGWGPADLVNWFRGELRVEAVVTVDAPALRAAVDDLSATVSRPPREPDLRFVAGALVLTPGQDGRSLDEPAVEQALVNQFFGSQRVVQARLLPEPPTVSEVAAEAARRSAQQVVDRPLTVTAGQASARLSNRALAQSVSFASRDGQLVPLVDGVILREALVRGSTQFDIPGRDATFRIRKGTPEVVPAVPGTTVAAADLARAVESALVAYPSGGVVDVPLSSLEPELTDARAEQLGIVEKLSTFTQEFPYAAYRVQNIGQAARYIDGTLLLPGETFSLNDTIKERTRANGYTVGYVIGPGGVFAEDLGGGVSTAATAMWTAAFFAGLERVETRAHSIYISRYTAGLEATVAWGVFDMRFRNDTPNGVFITARVTNTSIKITLWGTPVYDEVKAEFGPRHDIRPYSVVTDAAPSCLGQSGVDGFSIDVDRVFYTGGVEDKRQTIHTTYLPAPRVVCRASASP